MGGLFGVAAKDDCKMDVFYGTDYHSHLGTMFGGMAVNRGKGLKNKIHDIRDSQFRTKLGPDLDSLRGNYSGIGVISDFDAQPLVIESHLGRYAIATVGVIRNINELKREAFRRRTAHFTDRAGDEVSPTELIASLINQEGSFEDGIAYAQQTIEGSCTMLLLTEKGVYAARDRFGRTPIVIGKREESKRRAAAFAAASESCSFPTLDFQVQNFLGPGEVALITQDGVEQRRKPNPKMSVCSFLWVYYGFPASDYEWINTEDARNRCGAALARADKADRESGKLNIDFVAGIPDSGTGHAIGYADEANLPYRRPFTKYTPTWPRSFMPQDQSIRELVAEMKLIPIEALIRGKSLLFCEDSIVRGTQLRDNVDILFELGAEEVHMRPACPPLVYACRYLNFSRSRALKDLAGIRAIHSLEGLRDEQEVTIDMVRNYSEEHPENFDRVVDWIRKDLHLTTLRYQKLDDLVKAIGVPKERSCTYCWDAQG